MTRLATWLMTRAAVLAWTVVSVGPFVVILLLSARNNLDMYAHPMGLGGSFHAANYANAWSGPPGGAGMSAYLKNTAVAAATGIAVVFAIGPVAAYFTTRIAPGPRRMILIFLIACSVMPFVVVLVPMYQIYDWANLLNQPWALGVSYGALSLPTAMLILHAYLTDFPEEVVEAAGVDGLGPISTFYRIVLPLSTGPCIGVGMLSLIFIWGEAQLGIVLLQNAASQTISVGLLGYRGQWTTDMGPEFAGLALGTIPILLLYLALSRYVTKGVALGGIGK